ncbi:MAG: hypothetical protein WC708_04130 [Lentisphaeria bacterium]
MPSKFAIACLLPIFALLPFQAQAGERAVLDVNFASPSWRELMPRSGGAITQDGSAVALAPGAELRSSLLPLRPGETVVVTFEAACKGVQGDGYKIGWGTVSFFDKTNSPIGHEDLIQIRGDTPWRNYASKVSPSARCAFYTIDLTHSGTAGVVFYRNLKISLKDTDTEELVGDSGFEDLLGVNYWFFKRDGGDWDRLAAWEPAGRAEPDAAEKAAGRQSLRLSGGAATLVSKPFPYKGERLVLSGWLRSRGITAGKTGWAGGGVQLVGLAENGTPVCHEDLYINFGTRPWTFLQREIVFSGAVKKVQVWLRLFDGARGTLWLDEIRLRRIPAEKATLPFDKARSTITIDAAKPAPAAINYRAWAGVDALYAGWLLRPDVQQCLPYLKAAGIEYIRFREICNMLDLYLADGKDGKPVYNWHKFDQLCDLLVKEYGFIPVITIGTTPQALDRPGTRQCGWYNNTAPANFKKWGSFMEALFAHVVERYGKAEANKWLWELWNEPCMPATAGDYVGSTEDFVAMAEQTYLAKERVDQKYGVQIMMGLTSGGQSGGSDEYILNRLQAIGKLQLVEHRSRHYYAGEANSVNIVPTWIEESRELKKLYPGMKDYPVGCTEWNLTAMQSIRSDMPWDATLVVKMVKLFLDNQLDYSTFFAMVDHPEVPLPPAIFIGSGSLAMLTRPDDYLKGTVVKPVPKPVYNAFVFLNELRGGRRLPLTRSSEPVDGLAVLKPDGTIVIVLASYDEDFARQPYETRTTITITGLGGKHYTVSRILACDDQYGNSYGAWLKMGKPGIDDGKAIDTLIAKSRPVQLPAVPVQTSATGLQLTLTLPSPGIRLIELTPD